MRKLMCILALTIAFAATSYAVNHKDFFAVLIDLPGWTADAPTGMTITTGDSETSGKTITAEREYTKGDKRLDVVIISGSMAGPVAMYFSPQFSFMMTTSAGKDVVVKNLSIKGRPAKAIIDKGNNSITFYVLLTRTPEPGRSVFMAFSFENVRYNEAVSIIKRFPISRASKMANSL